MIIYLILLNTNNTDYLSRGVLLKRYFYKFRKIHRKEPVSESAFEHARDLRRLFILRLKIDTINSLLAPA